MKRYIYKETIPGVIIEFNGTSEEIEELADKEHIYIKAFSNYYEIEGDNRRCLVLSNELPIYFTIRPCTNFTIDKNMEIAREFKSALKFIDKPNKIFISGPMIGYKKFNFETFNFYEEVFNKFNIDCVNPVHIARKWLHDIIVSKKPIDKNSIEFKSMVFEELNELSKCDTIFLLGGWEYSNGAKQELNKAIELNLNIVQEMNYCNMFIFNKLDNLEYSEII